MDVFTVGSQREVAPSYGSVRQRIPWGNASPGLHVWRGQPVLSCPKTKPDSASSVAPTFPSQYSFAMATLNENSKVKDTKSSNKEEALVPSSIQFIYQRPTATFTASAGGASVGGVRQDDVTEQQAPERPHCGRPLSSTSTPPMIQRGKLMSEGDAGSPIPP